MSIAMRARLQAAQDDHAEGTWQREGVPEPLARS